MTYETDRDIKTMLAQLEVEAGGAPTDGSRPGGGWRAKAGKYWEK
jgi:hypothetical protein